MSSLQPPRRTADQTRRVRDLLRTEILASSRVGEALPSEEELRTRLVAPRAVVREALTLLQTEGIVTRMRGQGTFVTGTSLEQSLRDMHGVDAPSPEGIWNGRMVTRILDWNEVQSPPPVARTLGIDIGKSVLRIDYVAVFDARPLWCTTNYLVYPEASKVSPAMMRIDFYDMLRKGGISIGQSTYRVDTSVADELDVDNLDAVMGEPVLVVEQVVEDAAGRPINVAYARAGARGSAWVSRVSRGAAASGGA